MHVLCLLLWSGCGLASTEYLVINLLNLADAEFFREDPSLLTQREFQLVDIDFWGVVVNAPSRISTDRHDKLPLVIATRYSGERGWDVRLKNNAILVGTNLQDGTVHFAKAFVSERELASRLLGEKAPRGPRPSGLPIRSASIRTVDIRRRLNMKWGTGTWALGVINYDWPSNAVFVELKGHEPARYSEARPVSPSPNLTEAGSCKLSKRGGDAFPCYLRTSKTPALPKSGISFTAEPRMVQEEQRLYVFGAFTVPVRDFHLPKQKIIHQYPDGRQKNVTAVISVTMAVLGLDWDEPVRFDWAVPVYGTRLDIGMSARGCFAIDALAGREVNLLSAGKYVSYIVMDGRIFGPQLFEISE